MSSYPNGFNDGVLIREVPGDVPTSRKSIYVGNNATLMVGEKGKSDSTSNGTFFRPFATLDYAIGQAKAGDIIYVRPGHAETVATAGAINADVAGVTIVCLGSGANRPTYTFSDTAATLTVTAASVEIHNMLIKPSVDSVVSPIVVSAPDCTIDIEVQDASAAIECVSAILTTADADKLSVNLKYRGFIAGNACVSPIRLVGVDTARIFVDFYGVASTAVVEFHTTACHDIDVTGKFYNNGTSLTKNVVDTATGSTWSARGWDGNSNANFSGGDNAALASDDASTIKAAVDVIDGFHDVPTADVATNAQMRDVIGNKTDAAAAGAVSETESLMAYAKQTVTNAEAILADTDTIAGIALPVDPVADSLAAYISSGGTAAGTNLADSKSIVDALGFDGSAFVAGGLAMYLPRTVEKSDGAILTGNDDLFTITGGPIRAKITGIVTTIIGGSANGDLQIVTTEPAATFDLNAAPVAINDDASGTSYRNVGATSVFTPVTAGAVIIDPVTAEDVEFLLPIGTVHFRSSAAQTGNIKWYLTYWPLSPNSSVVAAA
jgi:hypothetical protein